MNLQMIREPAVAGMFYPATEKKLREQLEFLFNMVSLEKQYENVFGLISPHAGYVYSGKTAAFGYHTVSGKEYTRAIIISPSHREYFPGISIYEGDAYKTPLGIMPVDAELREKFIPGGKSIFIGTMGHKAEHALEVQLPFLQFLYGNISILPIVIGDQTKIYVDELANKLAELTDESTLIIASSDLSHFYSREKANMLDSVITERISRFQYDELHADLENRNCEACGGGGIVTVMKAASLLGKTNSEIIHRSDSGDTSGDTSEVVGYLSAVIY